MNRDTLMIRAGWVLLFTFYGVAMLVIYHHTHLVGCAP